MNYVDNQNYIEYLRGGSRIFKHKVPRMSYLGPGGGGGGGVI